MSKHRCPIFNKYIICASGFSLEDKTQIKKLIEAEGGKYQGDLVCGTTTHLVINQPKGEKYNFAKLWKISIVSSKWIFDSIEAKHCLPEKSYQLEVSANTSTPTNNRTVLGSKSAKLNRLDIDLSMIANTTTRNLVNETEDMRLSCSNTINYHNDSTATMPAAPQISKYSDILKELNQIGKIKSILFDGFGVCMILILLIFCLDKNLLLFRFIVTGLIRVSMKN